MTDMQKKPAEVQGKDTGQQYSDKTGQLREGKAKGQPAYVNENGDSENNMQINPNESRIMGNPSRRKHESDERPERESNPE